METQSKITKYIRDPKEIAKIREAVLKSNATTIVGVFMLLPFIWATYFFFTCLTGVSFSISFHSNTPDLSIVSIVFFCVFLGSTLILIKILILFWNEEIKTP